MAGIGVTSNTQSSDTLLYDTDGFADTSRDTAPLDTYSRVPLPMAMLRLALDVLVPRAEAARNLRDPEIEQARGELRQIPNLAHRARTWLDLATNDHTTTARARFHIALIRLSQNLGMASSDDFFTIINSRFGRTETGWATCRIYLEHVNVEIFTGVERSAQAIAERLFAALNVFELVSDRHELRIALTSMNATGVTEHMTAGSTDHRLTVQARRVLIRLGAVADFLVHHAEDFDEAVKTVRSVLAAKESRAPVTPAELDAAYSGTPVPIPPQEAPVTTSSRVEASTRPTNVSDLLRILLRELGTPDSRINNIVCLSDGRVIFDISVPQADGTFQSRIFRFTNAEVATRFMIRLLRLRTRLAATQRDVPANEAIRLNLNIDNDTIITDTSALDAVEEQIKKLEHGESRNDDDDEPPAGAAGAASGVTAILSSEARNTALRTIVAATLPDLGAAVSETASEAWTNLTRFFDTMLPVAEEGLTPEGFKVSIPKREDFLNLQRSNLETTKAGVGASATTGIAKSATLAGEMSKAGIGGALFASLNTVMIYSGVDEETRHHYLGGAGLTMLAVGLRTDPVHTVAALVYAIPGTIFGAGAGHVTAEVLPVSDEAKTSIREAVPMLGGAASAGYGLYKSARTLAALSSRFAAQRSLNVVPMIGMAALGFEFVIKPLLEPIAEADQARVENALSPEIYDAIFAYLNEYDLNNGGGVPFLALTNYGKLAEAFEKRKTEASFESDFVKVVVSMTSAGSTADGVAVGALVLKKLGNDLSLDARAQIQNAIHTRNDGIEIQNEILSIVARSEAVVKR